MRLFIAINFNREIKDKLMESIKKLKSISSKGNFTTEDNLHLTLVFIGETDNITAIKLAIDSIDLNCFELHFKDIGRFNRENGDIYWVGVKKDTALNDIVNQLKSKLRKDNFNIENNEFKPHITLGRGVALNKKLEFETPDMSMFVDKISLMKSERVNGKLVYTEIYKKLNNAR